MKIGVFDSGIGGKAVANSLQSAFPTATIITAHDHEHVPYGLRSIAEVIRLTDTAIQPLLSAKCDVIVIACNTATAAAIETLRDTYPQQFFVGLEPMVKPAAAMTHTKTICICATPATLRSERYLGLKKTYAANITVIEPDCSLWASLIENNTLNEAVIEATIDDACKQGADVIVLACTHYHWIRKSIETFVAGRAVVIDPSEAIVRRVSALLERS
jgi:glutamate racemase